MATDVVAVVVVVAVVAVVFSVSLSRSVWPQAQESLASH